MVYKGKEHLEILDRIVDVASKETGTDVAEDNMTIEDLYKKLDDLM